MKSNLSRIATVLTGLFLFITLLSPTAFAARNAAISIPVIVTAEGTLPEPSETYIVRMTADDPLSPMPNGQTGGYFDLAVTQLGSTPFPQIEYGTAGVFTYKIELLAGDNKDCTYDKSTYTMTVRVNVMADDEYEATVTLRKDGTDTKPDSAEFHNIYKTVVKPPKPPQTGDKSNLPFWLALMIASGIGIISITVRNEKKKRDSI